MGRKHKLRPKRRAASFAAWLVRAASHAPCLKLVDQALVSPPVEHQPDDEERKPHADRRIGAPDVGGVWPQVHIRHAAGWRAKSTLARTWEARSALRRRRSTSLRMALRWRAANRTVMAIAMTSSGHSSDGWMVGGPSRITLAGCCKLSHSTENLITGRMAMPTRLSTAVSLAAKVSSSMEERSAMRPI